MHIDFVMCKKLVQTFKFFCPIVPKNLTQVFSAFGDKKVSKKSHSAEQNSKKNRIVLSGFVSYVKKELNERGLFALT